MSDLRKPSSIEHSSTLRAASGPFASSSEQELIAVLRSFRDLIDTVLLRVCDGRREVPESSSQFESSPQRESVVSATQNQAGAPTSIRSETEDSSDQASVPSEFRNPDELLRAVEFLVRRGAREWQADPVSSSEPSA